MTDKQRQAISAVNNAKQKEVLDDEQYYLLLEFIMGNQPTTQYITWPIEKPNPNISPWVTYWSDSSGAKPI
jgi:hypothetical protein